MTTLSSSLRPGRIIFGLLILTGLLAAGPPRDESSAAPASEPIEVGYQDFTFPAGTGGNSEPTGEKPESKLWWNDGFWWGSLWNEADDAYHIYRLDLIEQTWVDTGTVLDNRLESRADVLWNGQHLYVVSHLFSETGRPRPAAERGRLYRYTYHPYSKRYIPDAGFPVIVTGGVSETLVLARDSTGTLWVTYVESRKVMINHSLGGNDRNWSTPFVLPAADAANLRQDDISSLIHTNGHIGVMWSNQNTKTMNFAVHTDGTPPDEWDTVVAYEVSADDHINLKSLDSDGAGSLFAVIKSSLYTDLIMLLVCRAGTACTNPSDWSAHPVYRDNTYRPTRPFLLIDTDSRRLYVFASAENESGEAGIYFKQAPIDAIAFPTGIGTPFIKESGEDINNPTSTKQNVNSTTGIVILASSSSSKYYFHNSMGGVPLPAPLDRALFLPFIQRLP